MTYLPQVLKVDAILKCYLVFGCETGRLALPRSVGVQLSVRDETVASVIPKKRQACRVFHGEKVSHIGRVEMSRDGERN